MKKHFKYTVVIIACLSLFFTGCKNEEGEGGTSTVEGKIIKVLHPDDDYTLSTDTILGAKTDVYIVYGDETYFGDDIETDDSGYYCFSYLTPGNYTVYAYSTLASGEKIAVSQSISVERGKTATMENIYIHEGKAYGTSIIKGYVHATYIDKNGDEVGEGWAYDQRVYIKRKGESYPFSDVRVGDEGVFLFQKLSPGIYEIYVISENELEIPSIVSKEITVEKSDTIVEFTDTFNIYIKV